MEKKTERIKFWLTDKELKQIDRKARKLGMNRSEYIRYLIANCKLVHTPEIDYEDYYNRLKDISDKINDHLIFLNQTGTELSRSVSDSGADLRPCCLDPDAKHDQFHD